MAVNRVLHSWPLKSEKESGKKSFETFTPKEQAQGLLDSLAGAIRLVAASYPEADFPAKAPQSFAVELELFVKN